MIHKLGYDCLCERCGTACTYDDIADTENGWCERCVDAYFEEQYRYWRPLYEGEKQAGLIPEKD
jgi:hypothetical protein